jgi:hypothetical protein
MGFKVIAPVGDNTKALFIGMKQFPTEKVILITPISKLKEATDISKKLEEFTIETEIVEISENVLEEMFKAFGRLCSLYDNDELIVNVATGDRMSTCAALSASYANGLKAFGIMEDKPMILPIMKLSYYNELSDNKLKILKHMDQNTCTPLKQLSDNLKMSISLLSYHINGNYKHKGLKEFRLVDVVEDDKSMCVKLSEMGNLLLKGYIQQNKQKK